MAAVSIPVLCTPKDLTAEQAYISQFPVGVVSDQVAPTMRRATAA
ncbi:hypothetical protein [Nocardia sp. IFM 10818]